MSFGQNRQRGFLNLAEANCAFALAPLVLAFFAFESRAAATGPATDMRGQDDVSAVLPESAAPHVEATPSAPPATPLPQSGPAAAEAPNSAARLTEPAAPAPEVPEAPEAAAPAPLVFLPAPRESELPRAQGIIAVEAPSPSEPSPPVDEWIWERDRNGNIKARIFSDEVLVTAGQFSINIWGGLAVLDPDSPETFRAQTDVVGNWGFFTLHEDGSWNYRERDDHVGFTPGAMRETFTVQSADGTHAQVVIHLVLGIDQTGFILG